VDFVLLLVSDGEAEASAAELGRRTDHLATWVADLRRAGVIRRGGPIDGPAVRVRTADGRPAVIDVPPDAAGSVRSWLLIDALDLDAALGVARSCPEASHGGVRVLPVDPDGVLS
jgi:hypothetical protein